MRWFALALWFVVAAAVAQAPQTAAAVTEPGRTLQRPLAMWLGGAGGEPVERTLLLVLDVGKALADAGFADALAAAIGASGKELANTSLGLAVVGERGAPRIAPSRDHAAVVAAVRQRLAQATDGSQNLFASLREHAATLAQAAGERRLLLVSLGNGDLEDQVEKTADQLARARVRVDVLTVEAALADTYWAEREFEAKQLGGLMVGGDAAVIDVPWDFTLQWSSANAITPAGHATWALSHLAATTQGRVFLYASAGGGAHECQQSHACRFCTGDHRPQGEGWNATLVAQYAPLALARDQVGRELGADPAFAAVLEAWEAAAKAGLVGAGPALETQGGAVRPARRRVGRDLRLFGSYGGTSAVRGAEQAAKTAAQLRDRLAARLDELGEQGSPRSRVIGRYTAVMLQVTRVNLLAYVAWCAEIPQRAAQDGLLPPEQPLVAEPQRAVGIGMSPMGLCHGVRPFLELELPGGEPLRDELRQLDAMVTGFLHRHGRSPFGTALRSANLALFHPTYPGIAKGPAPKRRRGVVDDPKPVTPVRPERRAPAGGGAGGAGGPTTGGGE